MDDRRKCQTSTATPAEPGGLPLMLGTPRNFFVETLIKARIDAIDILLNTSR